MSSALNCTEKSQNAATPIWREEVFVNSNYVSQQNARFPSSIYQLTHANLPFAHAHDE